MNGARLWQAVQILLREIVHLRTGWLIVLVCAGVVASGGLLRSFHFGSEEPRFMLGAAEFALRWGGVLLLAMLAAGLLRGGAAGGLAALLLVRGMSWLEWIVAVWLALLAATGALVAACAMGLALTLLAAGYAAAVPVCLGQLLLGVGPLAIVSGAALLAAAIARSAPLAVFLVLAIALAGQLAPIIRLAQQRSEGAGLRLWQALDFLVPDFSVFASGGGPWPALYALGYAVVFAAAAAWMFSRRED